MVHFSGCARCQSLIFIKKIHLVFSKIDQFSYQIGLIFRSLETFQDQKYIVYFFRMRKNLIRAISLSNLKRSSNHVSREVQSSSSDESRNFRMFKWTAISSGLAAFYYLHERSKTEALCKFFYSSKTGS